MSPGLEPPGFAVRSAPKHIVSTTMLQAMLRPGFRSTTSCSHHTACAAPLVHRTPRLVTRTAEVEVEIVVKQSAPEQKNAWVPGSVLVFDASQFEDLLQRSTAKLVVVDVFTQWCGPCKMIAPELEQMAVDFGDKAIIAKIDCTTLNENKKWAMGQKVRALPTFLFFKGGERITEMTGAKGSHLRKLIENNL